MQRAIAGRGAAAPARLSYVTVGTYTDSFAATTLSDDTNPANSTSSVTVTVV